MSSVSGNSNQSIVDAFNKLNQDAGLNDAKMSGQIKSDAQELLKAITNGADLSPADKDSLLAQVNTLLPMAGEAGHAETWNPDVQKLADSLSSIVSSPSSGSSSNAALPMQDHQVAQKQSLDQTQASSGSVGASGASGTQPANSISAADLGVKGDGATDITSALQSAIQTAKSQGKSLWLPPGTYNHSGPITLDGATLSGAGSSTILKATSPSGAAIKLTGDSPGLSNLATQVSASTRSSQPQDCAVLLQNAQNAKVTNLSIDGASANGIRVAASNNCKITNNQVNGSNADGIALFSGSSNNLIQRCQVTNASDDSFSSDNYKDLDSAPNSGNTFDSCYAGPNRLQGRGFALMGSSGDTIKNSVSEGSLWHGIISGADSDSNTWEGKNANISNNLILGAKGDAVRFTQDNGKSASSDGGLGTQSNNKTSGDIAATLGWSPNKQVADPNSFSGYTGGGSGSNNSGGQRT